MAIIFRVKIQSDIIRQSAWEFVCIFYCDYIEPRVTNFFELVVEDRIYPVLTYVVAIALVCRH